MGTREHVATKEQAEKAHLGDEARVRAQDLLIDCIGPYGLMSSLDCRSELWSRDAIITGLGALLATDTRLHDATLQSLITLRAHQTGRGLIPSKIDFDPKRVHFRACADAGLWYVIASCAYAQATRNTTFANQHFDSLTRTIEWYRYQDTDQSGLIAIQEGADWKDLFAIRGKGLYVNVLFYMALTKLAETAQTLGRNPDAASLRDEAARVRERINERLWYAPDKPLGQILQDSFVGSRIGRKQDSSNKTIGIPAQDALADNSYYLAYVTLCDFGEWFDTLGNLLAVISGVADKVQSKAILDLIEEHQLAYPYPIRAVYPPVQKGEKDWRHYYEVDDLNIEHQYHNGGVWPFIGGFYVAALIKGGQYAKAKEVLEQLARANALGSEGQWEFNEWIHGLTYKASGMRGQAWSAGMYLFAHSATKRNEIPLF